MRLPKKIQAFVDWFKIPEGVDRKSEFGTLLSNLNRLRNLDFAIRIAMVILIFTIMVTTTDGATLILCFPLLMIGLMSSCVGMLVSSASSEMSDYTFRQSAKVFSEGQLAIQAERHRADMEIAQFARDLIAHKKGEANGETSE